MPIKVDHAKKTKTMFIFFNFKFVTLNFKSQQKFQFVMFWKMCCKDLFWLAVNTALFL